MRTAKFTLVVMLAGSLAPVNRGTFRLVSIDALPSADGDACAWPRGGVLETAAYAQTPEAAAAMDPTPLRAIEDNVATFSAVAVDPVRNEIVLQDENLCGIL